MLLLFDLRKAFDMVNRDVLFDILRKRCKNDQDNFMVSFIEVLYRHGTLKIGEHIVVTTKEVPQGSLISSCLFKIYLEEALLQLPTWNKMIELDKLKALADDLLVSCNEPSTASMLIKELEEIDSNLGLNLNKKKSVILS
jgi:hypothetical protein